MNEAQVKQVAAEWSQVLSQKGIPHIVFGSAAMLLHGCRPKREVFKDVDLLVPEDCREGVIAILVERGFAIGKNKNYVKDDVTIGVATPQTHPGLRSPMDDSASEEIAGVRVLKLDYLIEAKRLAVESRMKLIVEGGYRSCRRKSALHHLEDFCLLCSCRENSGARRG